MLPPVFRLTSTTGPSAVAANLAVPARIDLSAREFEHVRRLVAGVLYAADHQVSGAPDHD